MCISLSVQIRPLEEMVDTVRFYSRLKREVAVFLCVHYKKSNPYYFAYPSKLTFNLKIVLFVFCFFLSFGRTM